LLRRPSLKHLKLNQFTPKPIIDPAYTFKKIFAVTSALIAVKFTVIKVFEAGTPKQAYMDVLMAT